VIERGEGPRGMFGILQSKDLVKGLEAQDLIMFFKKKGWMEKRSNECRRANNKEGRRFLFSCWK